MRTAPFLRRVALGDAAAAWSRLGFAVDGEGVCQVGGVALELRGHGGGFAGWTLAGDGSGDVDDLATAWVAPAGDDAVRAAAEHPNGVIGIDHVVLLTGSLARTTGALEAAGAEIRRVAEVGTRRTAFLWLGDVICEVAEAGEGEAATLWGLTLVTADLDATAVRLGDALAPPRAAVQPGRRIAPLRRDAGLGLAVAFITPHVRKGSNPVRDGPPLDAGAAER